MKHPRAFRVFLLGSVATWAMVSGTWTVAAATPGAYPFSSMDPPLGAHFSSWMEGLPFFGSNEIHNPSGSADLSEQSSVSPVPIPVPLPEQPPIVVQPHAPTASPDPPAQQSADPPPAQDPKAPSPADPLVQQRGHPSVEAIPDPTSASPHTPQPPFSSNEKEEVPAAQESIVQSEKADPPSTPRSNLGTSDAQTSEKPLSLSSQMTLSQLKGLPNEKFTKQTDQQAQQWTQSVDLAAIQTPIEVQAERLDATHAHMSLALSPTLRLEHATLSNLKITYQANNGTKVVIEVPQAQADNLTIQSSLFYYVPTALKMLNTPLSLLVLLLGGEVDHLSLTNVDLKVSQQIAMSSMNADGLSLNMGQ